VDFSSGSSPSSPSIVGEDDLDEVGERVPGAPQQAKINCITSSQERAFEIDGQQSSTTVHKPAFSDFMQAYPHPRGFVDRGGYRPSARTSWDSLSLEQKQAAMLAAPNAPGTEWPHHWLDDGRVTGTFEIVEQRADLLSWVWVPEGTPESAAWDAYFRAAGKPNRAMTDRQVNGRMQIGRWFKSQWPPGHEQVRGA
jgi:hypothetical protein